MQSPAAMQSLFGLREWAAGTRTFQVPSAFGPASARARFGVPSVQSVGDAAATACADEFRIRQ